MSEFELDRLKNEIEKTRFQLYIFYELSQAMRTTLHLDEVAYIILTGLTAHHGLGFNRALLFLTDEENKQIYGFMGIGPMDSEEANTIWKAIEKQKMDLYTLIEKYHRIKKEPAKPKFMEFTRSLRFTLTPESGILYEALHEINPLHIDITQKEGKGYIHDPLVTTLKLEEFIIASLWSKDTPLGVIVVDNCITHKTVSEDEIRILTMFVKQAAAAIENSKVFEHTLIQSHTDSLTNLWNYGYFQYKLDEEIMKAKNQGHEVSVLMLDLDDFKKFNDTLGHQAGDEVLKTVGIILRNNSRKIDIVARYGGEEFALILPYTNKTEAKKIAERIRKSVEQISMIDTPFTVSIGIACFDEDARDKTELIKEADSALYRAKNEGKNKTILA